MAVIFGINTVFPTAAVGYNWFNIAVSTVLGVPGAGLVCILNKLLTGI